MSNAAEQNQVAEVPLHKLIDKTKDRFLALAPGSMKYDAEKGYAIQLLENNDYLFRVANENPSSFLQAVTNVAAIGLSLNPAKKQAYLIPRNCYAGKDNRGKPKYVSKVFLEPSYMGLCDLATMSGSIKWVQAFCVYANDTFTDNGPGEKPTHVYQAFASKEQRGDFVGVYCVAKTDDGDYLTTVMPKEAVLSIRDRSESYKKWIEKEQKGNGGPWVTDFEEQAKKTVIRRGFKTWPKTETLERLEMAVHLSNENEGFEPITSAPEIRSYTAEQKAYFDQLISQSDHIGMFLFLNSLDYGVNAALFNSFEKGTITKYKDIVRELQRKGSATLLDCITEINNHAEGNDSGGIQEIVDDLPADAVEYIKDHCSQEAAAMIRDLEQN